MPFRASLFVVFLLLSSILWAQSSKSSIDATVSLEKKWQHVEENGARAHPDQTPTQFTEQEINAYITAQDVELPPGVQSLHFEGESGTITAKTRVNFDELKNGRNSSNPLLEVFSGTHDVVVQANANGAGHQGFVHVNSVQIDGIEVPRFVLKLFVEKYIEPKYPGIGLDSQFALPDKIDTATVGNHVLTITQK